MGQGHPLQDTMMLLPCPARTGMLCPAMPHHAQPRSREQPLRNGSQATFSTISRAQGTHRHP